MRRIVSLLHAGTLGEDGVRFGEQLERYLAGARHGLTLEEACGLTVSRGGEPWWIAESRKRRAAWLEEFRRRYCPGGVVELAREITEYLPHWQARDRDRHEVPRRWFGTPRELLFRAFREDDAGEMPTSVRQLRRILAEGHEIPPFGVPSELVS